MCLPSSGRTRRSAPTTFRISEFPDGMRISMSHKRLALIIVSLLFVLNAAAASLSIADQTAANFLKQVREEPDPAKRIELLDLALKDSSLKGDALGSVFFERAMAYKAMNDCFRAIEDFDSSLAHSRKAPPALLEKAHCLILVDQLDEAFRVLETVLLTAPATARAYVLKGMIYEKEGFLSKAEDEYTRALDHDSESFSALDMRARLLLREGKPRKALDDMNALSRLAPKDPDVFMTRARIHVKLKDSGAALADYARVESLTPGDDRVLKEKVPVFFEMDQPEKALTALTTYGTKHPDDVEVLVLEARAHILLKAYQKAEQILKRARRKETTLCANIPVYGGGTGPQSRSGQSPGEPEPRHRTRSGTCGGLQGKGSYVHGVGRTCAGRCRPYCRGGSGSRGRRNFRIPRFDADPEEAF